MAKLAAFAAEEKKAENISILNVGRITLIADYFVICSARNRIQVKSIVDNILERFEKVDLRPQHIEGYDVARWVLIDFGAVIVHVFAEDERNFYNLERLWADAPRHTLQSTVSDTSACRMR